MIFVIVYTQYFLKKKIKDSNKQKNQTKKKKPNKENQTKQMKEMKSQTDKNIILIGSSVQNIYCLNIDKNAAITLFVVD